jgi:acetoin utilization deacetylase AcuC-like enzyme
VEGDINMPLYRSGLVFHPSFLVHDAGQESTVTMRTGTFEISPTPHPSSLFITKRIKECLDGTGLTERMLPINARIATEDELASFHSRAYIRGLRECVGRGPFQFPWGEVDDDTVLSPASYDAALYAAGGAMNAVRAVMDGQVRNAYALLRPPGHHATHNQAIGFCLFNNIAVAANWARATYGLERIMIIDWDVHHGNGTQEAFYDDDRVLFVSLHQQDWFPDGSGTLMQVGEGIGEGYTVNIPLPPGTGDQGYLAAFNQLVLPLGRQYRPQLILVSAGEDGSWLDPLATMMLTMQGYRSISQLVVNLAEEVCDGRLVVLQEGGYSAPYVPYCVVGVVEPMLPFDSGIIDLYDTAPELHTCQTVLSQETTQALEQACDHYRQWWQL